MGSRLGTLALFGILAAMPASAHHAVQAEFDYTKEMKLTGVLKRVDWINPHAYFLLDVTDGSGKVTTWSLATVGPGGLRKAGLSRAGFFEVGKTYTVTAYSAKDGSKDLAWVKDFKFPDGRIVTIWFGDPNGQ